jgi:hypothetical protein
MQVGGKVNEGKLRIQYTSGLDEDAEPQGAKEWRRLGELRPAPPAPPKDWLLAVRTNEVLELRREEGWLEVFVEEKLLPTSAEDEPRFAVRAIREELGTQARSCPSQRPACRPRAPPPAPFEHCAPPPLPPLPSAPPRSSPALPPHLSRPLRVWEPSGARAGVRRWQPRSCARHCGSSTARGRAARGARGRAARACSRCATAAR